MNLKKKIGFWLIILSIGFAISNSYFVFPKLIGYYFGVKTEGKIICKKSGRKMDIDDVVNYSVEYKFSTPSKIELGSSYVWESYYNSNRIGDNINIRYLEKLPFFNAIEQELENNFRKEFLITLIIANIILFLFSFYCYTKYLRLEKIKKNLKVNGTLTIGKIDEIEEYASFNNKVFYKIHYSYSDNIENNYVGEEIVNHQIANKLKIGDEVKIYYDSQKPYISAFERIVNKIN